MFSWVLCYLSCCRRYWRTQFVFTSLRTSFSALFPSLLSIISRRNFLFLTSSKIPKWSAQVDEAPNSLFTLANSFIFKTHSFTLRQHLPQMPPLSPRDMGHYLGSLWAIDPMLPITQAWARPSYSVQETKRCLLLVWILPALPASSTWWLPAHPLFIA